MKCANCGEETSKPGNSDYQRLELGWCVPCFRSAKKACREPELWDCQFRAILANRKAILRNRLKMLAAVAANRRRPSNPEQTS